MKNNVDLRNADKSFTAFFVANKDELNAFTTNEQLAQWVRALPSRGVSISVQKMNEMCLRLSQQNSFSGGMQYLYNAYLCGCGMGVASKRR